jgi:hypothetical protein
MTHIIDEEYRGHEIVFLMQSDGLITVDIRSDNFDGEMLQGYSDLISVVDARNKATGFIDGYKSTRASVIASEVMHA